ncbi:hypothetical protein PV328_003886 [Microctonus aethiopoides]|uniref:BZIP domain-containing protein n=1 Tax=Microctonus aethiopoides TaxID=144406 RepID=A0AA39KKZ9_9HYME|nr:hypothetical protein PV328_003886 [Microctonus aethiopoides]
MSWSTSQSHNYTNTTEESIHSIWEEDYQDLSDWCIDTFQSQCVFHTDESKIMIHSGMKIGDMSLSNEGVGDIIESGENDDKSMINTMGETDKNISDQETILTIDNKKENLVDNLNMSDGWLNLPQSSTAARTDEWVKLIDSQNNNQALQQFVKTENNNFHTVNNQQKGWDIINTDSNAFDLLSYLCDDEIQTSDDVSMESATVNHEGTIDQATIKAPEITLKRRSNRRVKAVNNKSQTITSAAVTAPIKIKNNVEPSTSTSAILSKKNQRSVSIRKRNEDVSFSTGVRKRTIDTDSDDLSSNYSYKESREKNNEASRKSRMNKKAKEKEIMLKADDLERKNRLLKIKVEQLDKMVTNMRATILKCVLNRNN